MKRKSLNLMRGLTWLRYTLKMAYRMMGVNTTAGHRRGGSRRAVQAVKAAQAGRQAGRKAGERAAEVVS